MATNPIKYALALILAAVFIAGCSLFDASDGKSASLSFRVTGEMASKIASARSLSEDETQGIFLDIALKGDYEAERSISVKEGSAAVFGDIPVDSVLWAEAVAYSLEADGKPRKELYTGRSDEITIREGENTLNLVMKKVQGEAVKTDEETDGEAVTFTVTVNAATNGSVSASSTSAAAGAEVTLTVTHDSGYELETLTVKDGSNNDVAMTNNKFTMPESNVTVNATFKAKTTTPDTPSETATSYTVTFDANGGTAVEKQTVESGKTATKPADPTKAATDGVTYTFAGWYSGETAFDFATPITADTTLKAKWTETATHEYVDLGLSVKWVTCNIGEEKQEEYGDYFAWGETAAKNDYYNWSTYQFTTDGGNTMTKYTGSDNKTVLDAEDDAATANRGSEWRMPTIEEMKELRNDDNCTWEWQAAVNTAFGGVKGYKVTSKKDGYTDKYIFLPAAGYRNSTDVGYADSRDFYWPSSLYADAPNFAYYLYFYSDAKGCEFSRRYSGRSVRPVRQN